MPIYECILMIRICKSILLLSLFLLIIFLVVNFDFFKIDLLKPNPFGVDSIISLPVKQGCGKLLPASMPQLWAGYVKFIV